MSKKPPKGPKEPKKPSEADEVMSYKSDEAYRAAKKAEQSKQEGIKDVRFKVARGAAIDFLNENKKAPNVDEAYELQDYTFMFNSILSTSK